MSDKEFDPFFYRYGISRSVSREEQQGISKWDWHCYLFFTQNLVGRFIFNGLKHIMIILTRLLEALYERLS